MKNVILAAVAVLALTPALAHATDAVKTEATHTETTSAMTTDVEAKEATMKDGTKVWIKGDTVWVAGADGAKTAAPDGTWEMADGTKVKTMGGKIVK